MQEKHLASFFLEIFVVVVILGTLSAIALPRVGEMINKGKIESRDSELHNIQTAVTGMLCDSMTMRLVPVGPTANMSQVHTTDTPPLVLADYLLGLYHGSVKLKCTYAFDAYGKVRQILP